MAGTETEDVKTSQESEPRAKKLKGDEEGEEGLKNLKDFKPIRVLNCDSRHKSIVCQGEIGGERAVVLLEKKAFDVPNFEDLCTEETVLHKVFHNDVYWNYDCSMASRFCGVKSTVICPANEKHILKFTPQELHIVEETAEVHRSVTAPFLEEEALNLQWVYNILEGKSEQDRIVLEDADPKTGFVLLPDLKWNTKDLESLYLLVIVRQRGIKSIRDLTGEHLPLLKNIHTKCMNALRERYGLAASRIRAFLHYQPSFYHLHIHFTYLQYEAPGIHAERAHLLTSVINNIEMVPNYYQTATIPFTVKKTERLFDILKKKGLVD